MEKIKIVIADSHFLSRKGLSVLIQENIDLALLAESISSSDLINKLKLFTPHLIIIDYTSENFSLESIAIVTKKYPSCRILAITQQKSDNEITIAMKMGVTSHLLKDCDMDEITEAIYKTSQGISFMCSKIVSEIVDKTSEKSVYNCVGMNISEREMEIIGLIAQGLSNKEVADKLFLSTHTIITHRKNIMNKLGVNNTAGLVLFAVRENLVSPNHFLFSGIN